MGSSRTHGAMLARLAKMTGRPAVLPDYRLAPEHPYPAGLGDAEAVWDALRSDHPADRIVLGGDSSGGGLMLAMLARLLARGERPAAAVAFAPFTDLTGASPSLAANADADPLLPVGRFHEAVAYYLAGADPRDPGASPLFADFPGCPPVHIQVARTEILRDDSLRMAERLRGFGAEVSLDLWEDTPHVAADLPGLAARGRCDPAPDRRVHPAMASRSPARRKLTASATWRLPTASEPSRSAIVRATRRTR